MAVHKKVAAQGRMLFFHYPTTRSRYRRPLLPSDCSCRALKTSDSTPRLFIVKENLEMAAELLQPLETQSNHQHIHFSEDQFYQGNLTSKTHRLKDLKDQHLVVLG